MLGHHTQPTTPQPQEESLDENAVKVEQMAKELHVNDLESESTGMSLCELGAGMFLSLMLCHVQTLKEDLNCSRQCVVNLISSHRSPILQLFYRKYLWGQ